MNLYLLRQETNNDYDTFDAAVVAAESAEEARLISPSGSGVGWTSPENVIVSLLGTSDPEQASISGIILASFNAG